MREKKGEMPGTRIQAAASQTQESGKVDVQRGKMFKKP